MSEEGHGKSILKSFRRQIAEERFALNTQWQSNLSCTENRINSDIRALNRKPVLFLKRGKGCTLQESKIFANLSP